MLRRTLLHTRRYPSMTVMLIGQPIIFLLLFVHVFGNVMGAGLGGAGGGRDDYLVYITPAILLMTVACVAMSTAISVATDMTEGIVAQWKSCPPPVQARPAGLGATAPDPRGKRSQHVGGSGRGYQTALPAPVSSATATRWGSRCESHA